MNEMRIPAVVSGCSGHTLEYINYALDTVGAGCQAQTGYVVMQPLVDPFQVSPAISFMLLGLTLGLSIADSIFVNKALEGLQHALPNQSRGQLLSAITGTSGDLFNSLSRIDQIVATNTLKIALRFIPVYVAAAVRLVASVFLVVTVAILFIAYAACCLEKADQLALPEGCPHTKED